MKLLYGVQGTGNGHLSRAYAMADAFRDYPDLEITWLYSGRQRGEFADLPASSQWRRGMTFVSDRGRISHVKTLLANNIWEFIKDVRELDLSPYDCVITDYEPTIAWAARLRGIPTVGIGHQYAFNHGVPMVTKQLLGHFILRRFAPADCGLGLHWHHFDQPILPPIIDLGQFCQSTLVPNKVVVYLPFEDSQAVIALLGQCSDYEFYVYAPNLDYAQIGNVHTRPLSRYGFKQDLMNATGVICNAGFELIGECLSLGIKMLAKPLHGQVEQACNAEALRQLGYADVVDRLTLANLRVWLQDSSSVQIDYPQVHPRIAQWLATGQRESLPELSGELWQQVTVHRRATKACTAAMPHQPRTEE